MAKTKRINLALQGGGAHGAFTWGVLDQLLDDARIAFGMVSATSAGAVNAVGLAAGFAEGGPAGAKSKLAAIWQAIHKAGVPDFIRLNPVLASLSTLSSTANMSQIFSPYAFNPMGFDPLKRVLNEHIDFAKIRSGPIELLISATDISTGRARHFTRDELTVDSVLASTCLPTLHHAVKIDGRAYWDGGFSANPELIALAKKSAVEDTLIVLLTPTVRTGVPVTVEQITSETNRLTFNAPLMRDCAIIEALREESQGPRFSQFRLRSRLPPLLRHRFHLVDAGCHTMNLSAGSKMKPDWGMFTNLRSAGRTETYKWLDGAYADIGHRSTVDLRARFLESGPSELLAKGTDTASNPSPKTMP